MIRVKEAREGAAAARTVKSATGAEPPAEQQKPIEKYPWEFKKHFRSRAFGWRGTALGSKRIREAVSEIKAVARHSPVDAGEGVVILCERLWPALQQIDTSSGALGTAIVRALDALLPLLMAAPVDPACRRKWLDRLSAAIDDDGVDWLCGVRHVWGQVCIYPELMDEWITQLLPQVRDGILGAEGTGYFLGTDMCLSCMLEAGRYDELETLLGAAPRRHWDEQRFWAEALMRLERPNDAVAFAEGVRSSLGYDDASISSFCEAALLSSGQHEEAYRRYAMRLHEGQSYLNQFRALAKLYPMFDAERIIRDLIEQSRDPGAWFASARQAGLLDLAMECALAGEVDPGTLPRAARDTVDTNSSFSFEIAARAIELLSLGHGYGDLGPIAAQATASLIRSAVAIGNTEELEQRIRRLAALLSKRKDYLSDWMRQDLGRTWPSLFN